MVAKRRTEIGSLGDDFSLDGFDDDPIRRVGGEFIRRPRCSRSQTIILRGALSYFSPFIPHRKPLVTEHQL